MEDLDGQRDPETADREIAINRRDAMGTGREDQTSIAAAILHLPEKTKRGSLGEEGKRLPPCSRLPRRGGN